MSMVDRLSRAVASKIVAARRRRRPAGLAVAVASAVAKRLGGPGRPSRRPGTFVASGPARRLAGPPAAAAASLAPRSLQGGRLAERVARQVASQIPESRLDFSREFSNIDVAKVAAAVVAKLDARRSKGLDPVDVIASQIAARLSVPRLQGSAAGATDFQNRIVSAVSEAVKQQRAVAAQLVEKAAAQAVATPAAAKADTKGDKA